MATIVPDMKNRRLFFLVVLLIAAFVPALPTGAQTLLRVATPGALTGALPIYLGAKKGVFSKYGLTVEVIATRNEQMNMQALMSDSVQFLGLTVILIPLEYVWGINITRKVFMNKNRETVKNYLRGLAESVRLMMADKASTIAVMSRC
jgi:ABC-type nitrate/sulfonate/bicarbonate transport system substrate-binding protein